MNLESFYFGAGEELMKMGIFMPTSMSLQAGQKGTANLVEKGKEWAMGGLRNIGGKIRNIATNESQNFGRNAMIGAKDQLGTELKGMMPWLVGGVGAAGLLGGMLMGGRGGGGSSQGQQAQPAPTVSPTGSGLAFDKPGISA